jgi:DNA-binding transcriptional ArsR family regulator
MVPDRTQVKSEELFKALGSEIRLEILRLLSRQVLCVGALAARLDITQSAASQHLQVLRRAGLVVAEKRGYYVHYRLSEHVRDLCEAAISELFG